MDCEEVGKTGLRRKLLNIDPGNHPADSACGQSREIDLLDTIIFINIIE